MGQLYLDVIGKKGMMAIWCVTITVQVSVRYYVSCDILTYIDTDSSCAVLRRAWMRPV